MNNISEQIAVFFFLLDYSLMYIAQSGITGSFKRWKQFGRKRCNGFAWGIQLNFQQEEKKKTVDNSRFRPLLQEDRGVFMLSYQHGTFCGVGVGGPVLNMPAYM